MHWYIHSSLNIPLRKWLNKMSANPCKFWLTLQFFHSPCLFFCLCQFPLNVSNLHKTLKKKKKKKISSKNDVGQPDLLIAHVGNSQTDWLTDLIVMMFSTTGIVMLGLWPTLLATLVKRQTAMALHQLSADVNNCVTMNSEGTVKVRRVVWCRGWNFLLCYVLVRHLQSH